MEIHLKAAPLFENDAIVLGLLLIVLSLVFYTADLNKPGWKKFYRYVPALLLCYFLPALLHWPFGLIASEWHDMAMLKEYLANFNLSISENITLDQLERLINDFNFEKARSYLTYLDISFAENASFKDLETIFSQYNLNSEEAGQITTAMLKDISLKKSYLYNPVTSRYLLPACLILLCLGIDLKGIINLGPKALIMFFAATLGIVIGGPIALMIINGVASDDFIPATPEDVWRGLSTVAGSWIGGGANQTAMKEIFEVDDNLFGTMIIVDVVVANIWMGFLLYGANVTEQLDKWLKADVSAIELLKKKVSDYRKSIAQMPTMTGTFVLMAVAFGGVALSHWGTDLIKPAFDKINETSKEKVEYRQAAMINDSLLSENEITVKQYKGLIALQEEKGYVRQDRDTTFTISKITHEEGYENGVLVDAGLSSLMSRFFWLIVIATTFGLILSFTRARRLEGMGASRWGSIFIYILVASIGMKMNLGEVYENLGLFAIGIVWMAIHVIILLVTAKVIKAPFFFVAVGSQANVGGAASAPVVASAFSPSLAPVGVLMAVLGYALGTYGALICAFLMQNVSG